MEKNPFCYFNRLNLLLTHANSYRHQILSNATVSRWWHEIDGKWINNKQTSTELWVQYSSSTYVHTFRLLFLTYILLAFAQKFPLSFNINGNRTLHDNFIESHRLVYIFFWMLCQFEPNAKLLQCICSHFSTFYIIYFLVNSS